MRSHIFNSGPNMGVTTTSASPWEAQKYVPANFQPGAVAYGANRRWSAGLGSKLGPVVLADPAQPQPQQQEHKAADCPVCKVGRTGTLLGDRRSTLGQKQPPPPGVCCQKTPDGATVCSDGSAFPPN